MEAKAEVKAATSSHGQPLAVLDEEVFVSQLQRRARLLDDGFQAAVLRAVQAFAIPFENCAADNQSLTGVSIGCDRAIPLDGHHDNATTSAVEQTFVSVTLFRLNSASSTISNTRMDQGTLAHPSLSNWRKWDGKVGNSYKEGDLRRQYSLPSRKSSGVFDTVSDEQSSRLKESSSGDDGVVTLECNFRLGPGQVDVHRAPVKTAGRMLEKLAEYAAKGAAWPLTGCILDPVRASVVCAGPEEMMEVLRWFEGREEQTGLKVVRVKNKFGFKKEDLVGSYRDLMVCVLYRATNNLAIIGEIQVSVAI